VTTTGDVFIGPAPRFATDRLAEVLARDWGMARVELRALPSERDLNVLVDGRYVLKVSNPAEDPQVLDMEVGALDHARRADPGLPLPRIVPSASGRPVERADDDTGRPCLVRLITVLPGTPLQGRVVTGPMAGQVGAVAARTSLALQGYFHPAGGRTLDWDVRRLPSVARAADVGGALADLAARVEPALRASLLLPAGLQHADATLTNILTDGETVTGVIDLGDMHHTAAVCDLAATLTSVLRNSTERHDLDTWALADAVLRGYQRHRPLSPAEADVLGELVLARLVLTLVISGARATRHPDNHTYITQYDTATDRVLDELAALRPTELAERFARMAGTSRTPRPGDQPTDDPVSTVDGLLARRAAAMGGGLAPLFYRRPLDVVRGEGPWLFTRDGARHLDAYNNVAVVGHAHPTVTQAVTRQFAVLNTHSRYLHTGVVELAERLLATMPPGLDTCLFTTSGTEANELAWRLATEFTGGDGAIIAEHAYHGSSKWMADLSSNEWPPGHRPDRVATFRAPHGPAAELTSAVAEHRIATAAERLTAEGGRPALVLADPTFTSEGVLDAPPAFLRGLLTGAHAAGALFLADEVQAGFGRSGRMWRFSHADITPDLVTLGKPMGAGYPVGALITRREIADVLARRYEYFSTFAATPVAAAAGLAVLDILRDNDIPEKAGRVGALLRDRLVALGAAHETVGQVRGTGLIAGIDLLAPDGGDHRAFAGDVLDSLTSHRVLAGLTGPGGNVLKVRPPLIWAPEHVDLFVDTLDTVLTTLAKG
jgi:4-aminobutyrate aminotransferase-like enzyme/Ser/Thr protein kinase RdoA (MazF antagonist)